MFSALSTPVLLGLAALGLVCLLSASEVLVRGIGRLATNLGLLGGLVGLLVALGANSPELSSIAASLSRGNPGAGVGVVYGSNVFNLAILLAGAALVGGKIMVDREALYIDAGVSLGATLILGLALLAWLPLWLGLVFLLLLIVPYFAYLVFPRGLAKLPLPAPVATFLARAAEAVGQEGLQVEAEIEVHLEPHSHSRRWLPVYLIPLALVLIVLAAYLMVGSFLTLGQRWNLSGLLQGVVILAAVTSLPNAYAAIRLALDHHSAALVSATFNSNTLNLVAGIAVPLLLFPSLRTALPWGYSLWALGMSVLALLLLSRGLGRKSALLLLLLYAAFVTYAVTGG